MPAARLLIDTLPEDDIFDEEYSCQIFAIFQRRDYLFQLRITPPSLRRAALFSFLHAISRSQTLGRQPTVRGINIDYFT
jgi:hypothetical protein